MSVLGFGTVEEVAAAVPLAVSHLTRGGLVAHPTETVYGLGSRARESEIQELARLKQSPGPFLILVASLEMVHDLGLRLPRYARELVARYWPGPLTLVVEGGEGLPSALRGPGDGIAVRWTSHVGLSRLVSVLGEPITSTSANLHGGETAPTARAVIDVFGHGVSEGRLLILDGGTLEGGSPSTVVDCLGQEPRLVREGAIRWSEIRRVAESMAT